MSLVYDERLDGALPRPDKAQLLQRLRAELPEHCLLHDREDLKPYECDGLAAYRTTPLLVVLPETVEQVQATLRLCHELQVPLVARGAGTACRRRPAAGAGRAVVMARFNRILEVDPTVAGRGSSPGCATWPSPRPRRPMTSTTRPIPPRRSPAPSAATWPRTPAACTA